MAEKRGAVNGGMMDIEKEFESMFEAAVPARTGITDGEVDALMGAIADVIKEYVPKQLAPLMARIAEQDKIISDLQRKLNKG
jgi:hypothetical protein